MEENKHTGECNGRGEGGGGYSENERESGVTE